MNGGNQMKLALATVSVLALAGPAKAASPETMEALTEGAHLGTAFPTWTVEQTCKDLKSSLPAFLECIDKERYDRLLLTRIWPTASEHTKSLCGRNTAIMGNRLTNAWTIMLKCVSDFHYLDKAGTKYWELGK
jgi:hypothetical protein